MFAHDGDNELHVTSDILRDLARYGEMVGGGLEISCPKGFGSGNDGTLLWVEYSPNRRDEVDSGFGITLVYDSTGPVAGHTRHRICPKCNISPVVDLGDVTG